MGKPKANYLLKDSPYDLKKKKPETRIIYMVTMLTLSVESRTQKGLLFRELQAVDVIWLVYFFFNKKIIKILIEIIFKSINFLLISIKIDVCLCLGPDADLDKIFVNILLCVYMTKFVLNLHAHICKNKIKL